MEFGVFRRQRDGAVDAGQRRFGLAALQLGGRKPAQRLSIVGALSARASACGQGVGHRTYGGGR